jgi:uncharacterized membrane protein YhhN
MLFTGPSEVTTVWLTALLALWAMLLLGSVAASFYSGQKTASWLRLTSSLTLVVATWSWYLLVRATPAVAEFALLLALGMTFGMLGDLLLAETLPVEQGFLAGIGAFALGHIAYIAAILSLTPHMQWAIVGIALLVGLAGWYLVVVRGGTTKGNATEGIATKDAMALRVAALPYALLLSTTVGVAAGLAIQTPAFLPLAVGAALFLISDLLVAGERFGSVRFPHFDDVVWLTYGPAQMLIVYAVNSALVAATAR